MIALKTTQTILTWLCIIPADEATPEWKKSAYMIFNLGTFFGNIAFLLSVTKFLITFISVDLEGSLYALFQIAAICSGIYGMTIAFILRRKYAAMIETLSDIYDERKTLDTIQIDNQIDQISIDFSHILCLMNFFIHFRYE